MTSLTSHLTIASLTAILNFFQFTKHANSFSFSPISHSSLFLFVYFNWNLSQASPETSHSQRSLPWHLALKSEVDTLCVCPLSTLLLPHYSVMLVAQLCLTLCNPVDCSSPDYCPWNSPGKNTGVGCYFLLQGIFPTEGSNPGLLHCRQILYHLSHQGGLIMALFNFWTLGEKSSELMIPTSLCRLLACFIFPFTSKPPVRTPLPLLTLCMSINISIPLRSR